MNAPWEKNLAGWRAAIKPVRRAGIHKRVCQPLTDVLNRLVLEARFVPWQQGERDLALAHVSRMQPGDIALLDRGFASYELWAQFIEQQRRFVCRCPRSSFSPINELFAQNQAGRSVVVTLKPEPKKLAEIRRAGLPETITVRLVTVRLETGELEVLATNLLDETLYPTAAFAELYHYRWGIETYYNVLKSRLDLENFSGLTAEAIRQDLHAAIFLSNMESILIQPAQRQSRRAAHRDAREFQYGRRTRSGQSAIQRADRHARARRSR